MAVPDGVTGAEVSDKDRVSAALLAPELTANWSLCLAPSFCSSLFSPVCFKEYKCCFGVQFHLTTLLQLFELWPISINLHAFAHIKVPCRDSTLQKM